MGSYEWPCPKCGQAQKVRAPNGTEVQTRLCAACEEEDRKEKGFEAERAAQQEEHHKAGNGKAKASR